MFLFRLMSYLFGHVSLVVNGKMLEKFINMASSRGIYLWDITRISADKVLVKVRLSGVKPLRHIARETQSRFKITSREGIPFLIDRMKKRKMLVLGAFVFLLVLYMLSSFVWFIEVDGNDKIAKKEVLLAAKQGGLTPGVIKWNVDTAMVERAIKDQLPTVAWTGVYIKGTKATIEVVEKKMPEGADAGPAHLVAKKPGLVKDILVLEGQAAVEEGDTVAEGQILISGEILPEVNPDLPSPLGLDEAPLPMEMPRYVQAKGMVKARVWYEGYGEGQMLEVGVKPSGRRVERVCMKIAGKEIILKGPKTIPFTEYDMQEEVLSMPSWRNISVPVEINKVQYLEMLEYRQERTRAEAHRLAEQNALAAIKEQLPDHARVMEQRVERIETGQQENLVRVRVFVEALEDIGISRPFQP
ncbi:sporulation protein YqfD [Desulfofalx alkaliphila]|uniref:sporulation protein YqfD n=1 Tax=Desulfofalx alkaliphila TaxID=105483 RepID=UPI0004E2614D|nr:sporulation protein YqfD [Desulfofalx alkaliphila]